MTTQWANFYFALATIAAASAGLIFFAIGDKLRAWKDHKLRSLIGLRTFTDFLLAMLFGMLALIPDSDWRIEALVVAFIGCAIVMQYSMVAKRHPELVNSDFDKSYHDPFTVSASPYLLLGFFAIASALIPSRSSLPLQATAILMLILVLAGYLRVWQFYMHAPQVEEEATSSQIQTQSFINARQDTDEIQTPNGKRKQATSNKR